MILTTVYLKKTFSQEEFERQMALEEKMRKYKPVTIAPLSKNSKTVTIFPGGMKEAYMKALLAAEDKRRPPEAWMMSLR